MKKLIEQTELNLNLIKKEVRNEIEKIGTTKASDLTNLRKSYLSDWLHDRFNMSFEKIIKIGKKLFKDE